MPRLAVADREQVEQIYRESHAVWGIGLSPRDYARLWDEISSTPWARRHVCFYVWLDREGRVLSSLKLYRPRARVLGRTTRLALLGAIFTPRSQRRQGHAATLVRRVLEQRGERGDRLALLFSDIGTHYYETLGFRALPAEEHWGTLPRRLRGVPVGWELRPLEDGDLDTVVRAHRDSTVARSIAVLRDPSHWEFLELRAASYFRRLGDPDIRQRSSIASFRGEVAGFLIAVEGRGEWNVREVGALGGDAATMATILRLGAYQARLSGMRRFYGWLPRELLAQLGDWKVRSAPRRRAVPMVMALDDSIDVSELYASGEAYVPYLDQF